MIELLSRNALAILIGLCLVLAVTGLFFRADAGPEAVPLAYPLIAIVSVALVVLIVRVLVRFLEIRPGADDAD